MRGDFSAELSAATAAGCQQYAGTRGTKARSGAGAGAELPPSLPPAEPGGAPGSVRGAGAGPPGAGICPRCWSRDLSAVLGPVRRSRDLSAVLGSVPLRRSVEGSPPLAGHGEEAVPKGFQRGARRWEEEEGAGCPRGREGMPQPPSCPRRAGKPGVGAEVRRQFFAGDDAGLTGLGLEGGRRRAGDASRQGRGPGLDTPALCALLSAGPVLISRSARPEPGSSY